MARRQFRSPWISNGRSTGSIATFALLLIASVVAIVLATATGAGSPVSVPEVDLKKHSVPLDAVYFDTFRPVNRAVPLIAASRQLIRQLRDAIPPLHQPEYESAAEARWISDNDVVIGYAAAGEAWAYPLRILNYHEIVNDVLSGEPILVAYCPLCGSGVVFSRRVDERVLTFGNTSALYESDMVMLDYETGSYWWHVAGKAIVGTLTGAGLTVLPGMMTTWADWRRLHPKSKVLSRNTGHERPYERDPFRGYAGALNRGQFAFPVSNAARDGRLPPGASVLAVKIGTDVRAYSLDRVGVDVIMDRVAHKRVVVFLTGRGMSGAAYEPIAGTNELTFNVRDGKYVDRETGSVWDLGGKAVVGSMKGSQLRAVPAKTSFWFAIVAAEPTITVHSIGSD